MGRERDNLAWEEWFASPYSPEYLFEWYPMPRFPDPLRKRQHSSPRTPPVHYDTYPSLDEKDPRPRQLIQDFLEDMLPDETYLDAWYTYSEVRSFREAGDILDEGRMWVWRRINWIKKRFLDYLIAWTWANWLEEL